VAPSRSEPKYWTSAGQSSLSLRVYSLVGVAASAAGSLMRYSDEKVANRDIRVWHLVIENGY
jgi:hypothetical protein